MNSNIYDKPKVVIIMMLILILGFMGGYQYSVYGGDNTPNACMSYCADHGYFQYTQDIINGCECQEKIFTRSCLNDHRLNDSKPYTPNEIGWETNYNLR